MAKTKTITIKKHERILKALGGLEQNKPDSSKFRFWVKAKGDKPNPFYSWSNFLKCQFVGFTTERPNNFKEVPPFHHSNEPNNAIHLYIPNLTKVSCFMGLCFLEFIYSTIARFHHYRMKHTQKKKLLVWSVSHHIKVFITNTKCLSLQWRQAFNISLWLVVDIFDFRMNIWLAYIMLKLYSQTEEIIHRLWRP